MLKKIGVGQLRVGMHLHELCGSWMDHPFWRTKFVIKDPADIRLIADSGITEVWIDSGKGIDVEGEGATRAEVETQVDAGLQQAAAAKAAVTPPKRVAIGSSRRCGAPRRSARRRGMRSPRCVRRDAKLRREVVPTKLEGTICVTR